MDKSEKIIECSSHIPLYESAEMSAESTRTENADYSAICVTSMNKDNVYAAVSATRDQVVPEEVKEAAKCSKKTVQYLAAPALVASLLTILACLIAVFINVSELKATTDSLRQRTQYNSQLHNQINKSNQQYHHNIMIQLQQLNQTLNERLQQLSQVIDNHTHDFIYQQITHSMNITQELNITLQMQINQLTRLIFDNSIVSSCAALSPSSPSGYYWVRASDGSAVRVYCDMTRSCGNITGGWMRVAELDMTNSSHQCPGELRQQTNDDGRTCRIRSTSAGCSPTIAYSTISEYSKVCGKIEAYTHGGPDGFNTYMRGSNQPLNGNYVDGVSLTHGSKNHHIWTFAATDKRICSCNGSSGIQPPHFVGNNYFCDVDHRGDMPSVPLWQGADCTLSSSCCSFNSPPWFYRELPQPTTDDIEMRVCRDEDSTNEDILIQVIEMYVQ